MQPTDPTPWRKSVIEKTQGYVENAKAGAYLGHKSPRPLMPLSLICSHGIGEGVLMRISTDCTSRADECRRLAKLAAKSEDWQHFIEMAATWDMLAKQRPSDKLAETWALADAIANSRNLGLQ